MNLPVVIDIAIGLIFIYLTLSLLTSEIQELVAILFQWRAVHLKRSIENLITGNNTDDPLYQKFTDDLYSSPLIRALNQEAKGFWAVLFRKIPNFLAASYYKATKTRSVLGRQRSGPSYIASETFSVALLQKIKLKELSQKVCELTARQYSAEKLKLLREFLSDLKTDLGQDSPLAHPGSLLEQEYQNLEQSLKGTIENFVGGRTTLSASLEELSMLLVQFLDNLDRVLVSRNASTPEADAAKQLIRTRLSYLKQAMQKKQVEPTVTEVLRLIFEDDRHRGAKLTPWVVDILNSLQQEEPALFQEIAQLPLQLRRNLLSLADQARLKANSLQDGVRQLELEIATWFDESMERASGVYRRNAKGVAILIGFLFAVSTNSDTFYMVSRLSKDTILRSTVGQAADQVILTTNPRFAPSPSSAGNSTTDSASSNPASSNPSSGDPASGDPASGDPTSGNPVPGTEPSGEAALSCPIGQGSAQANLEAVKNAVNNVLNEMPLPLGWNNAVVAEQLGEERRGWIFPIPQRVLGWFITGIALSMGASFWYDLLSKFIRVRGTGGRPPEKSEV
ncbi:MAG: hypothetical protein MUF49_25080 [Oculatellaceae cyanobacterium Prado106]|nr:hypothetical protein [Oculatellaceae cyanobacterium Prado106]